MIAADLLDKVVLLVVAGASDAQLTTACRHSLGLSARKTAAAIAQARAKILAAAGQSRHEQLGLAILRLTDLYQRAQREGKLAAAMQAQRELNRLHALHTLTADRPADGTVATEAEETLARIAAHLLPLGLAPAEYPIEEHARLAAQAIRSAQPVSES